jgi:ABC-type multidrug transport system fused ATPase/permease subunit
MESGQIKAEGSLDFLLKNSEIFQKLWKHQDEFKITS